MADVPQLDSLGVDVLAPDTFEDFAERIKPFRGEIKGVITRGRVISGIGTAYVDEVLFEAEALSVQEADRPLGRGAQEGLRSGPQESCGRPSMR